MGEIMWSFASRLRVLWCKMFHPAPMWTVKGFYQCRVCLRSYPVPWEHHAAPEPVQRPAALVSQHSLRSAPSSPVVVPVVVR
jgi:hypothetical protein